MADRVLEIGNFAAGYCGRLLVHAGHDVVRVEPPVPLPRTYDAMRIGIPSVTSGESSPARTMGSSALGSGFFLSSSPGA